MLQGQLCVLGCGHQFQCTCIRKWLETDTAYRCPMCRTTLFKCTPSIPLTSLHSTHGRAGKAKIKVIQVLKSARPGLTVSTNALGGVRVDAVVKHDAAAEAGINVGDVITYMNDVPCNGHEQAISILEAAFEYKVDVQCTVKYDSKPVTWRRLMPTLRLEYRPFAVRGRHAPTNSSIVSREPSSPLHVRTPSSP